MESRVGEHFHCLLEQDRDLRREHQRECATNLRWQPAAVPTEIRRSQGVSADLYWVCRAAPDSGGLSGIMDLIRKRLERWPVHLLGADGQRLPKHAWGLVPPLAVFMTGVSLWRRGVSG
jgi:hypothetical protein